LDEDSYPSALGMGGRGVPEGIIGGDIEADCCCVEVGLGGVEAVLGKAGFLEAHNVGMLLLCPEVDHIYSFALCGGEAADVVGEDAEARSQGPARETWGVDHSWVVGSPRGSWAAGGGGGVLSWAAMAAATDGGWGCGLRTAAASRAAKKGSSQVSSPSLGFGLPPVESHVWRISSSSA